MVAAAGKPRHDPFWEARVIYGPRLANAAIRKLGGDNALTFLALCVRVHRAVMRHYAFENLLAEVELAATHLARLSDQPGAARAMKAVAFARRVLACELPRRKGEGGKNGEQG